MKAFLDLGGRAGHVDERPGAREGKPRPGDGRIRCCQSSENWPWQCRQTPFADRKRGRFEPAASLEHDVSRRRIASERGRLDDRITHGGTYIEQGDPTAGKAHGSVEHLGSARERTRPPVAHFARAGRRCGQDDRFTTILRNACETAARSATEYNRFVSAPACT